jgi:hypothetical protein
MRRAEQADHPALRGAVLERVRLAEYDAERARRLGEAEQKRGGQDQGFCLHGVFVG